MLFGPERPEMKGYNKIPYFVTVASAPLDRCVIWPAISRESVHNLNFFLSLKFYDWFLIYTSDRNDRNSIHTALLEMFVFMYKHMYK